MSVLLDNHLQSELKIDYIKNRINYYRPNLGVDNNKFHEIKKEILKDGLVNKKTHKEIVSGFNSCLRTDKITIFDVRNWIVSNEKWYIEKKKLSKKVKEDYKKILDKLSVLERLPSNNDVMLKIELIGIVLIDLLRCERYDKEVLAGIMINE